MLSFEDLMTSLQDCVIAEDQVSENGSQLLRLFFDKLSESSRLVPNLSMFENSACPLNVTPSVYVNKSVIFFE